MPRKHKLFLKGLAESKLEKWGEALQVSPQKSQEVIILQTPSLDKDYQINTSETWWAFLDGL